MKINAFSSSIVRIAATVSIAALLAVGFATARTTSNTCASVSHLAHHSTEVADGSESNGGKGGKGSNNLSRTV